MVGKLLTPRVCVTPKHQCPSFVVGISKHFMKLHCEPVQVTDMKWAKVGVKGVVEQSPVN